MRQDKLVATISIEMMAHGSNHGSWQLYMAVPDDDLQLFMWQSSLLYGLCSAALQIQTFREYML